MSDTHSLLSIWLDRRLTRDEISQLSSRLARDSVLADELAEMAGIVQTLTAISHQGAPDIVRSHCSRRMALTAAAVSLAVACIVGMWWRPTAEPPTIADAPPPPVSIVGSRPTPGGLPRPPRSMDERAQATLDRFLRRHAIARRSYIETNLREIAEECLSRLQQKHEFQGSLDFSMAGSLTEIPLTFIKPAGSLRGLLLHASALAGCTLVVNPNSLSFVPLPGSPTKTLTKRITAAAEAHESTRNFCATGTLPPTWGLTPAEFRAIPQPDGSLELTATEWRLAQLKQVIEAMDAPLLTVEVQVFALPSPEDLEYFGLQNFAGLTPTEATAPSPLHSKAIGGFPTLAVGSVLTESQWERVRPEFLAAPDSLLAEFSVPVLSGQWTDIGDRAPHVLRWDTQSLGLKGALSADELTFDLEIGGRFLGTDSTTKPAGTTSITVWMGFYLLLGYTDSAAAPGSRPRGLVLRVQPLD